eukprot:gene4133-5172_t
MNCVTPSTTFNFLREYASPNGCRPSYYALFLTDSNVAPLITSTNPVSPSLLNSISNNNGTWNYLFEISFTIPPNMVMPIKFNASNKPFEYVDPYSCENTPNPAQFKYESSLSDFSTQYPTIVLRGLNIFKSTYFQCSTTYEAYCSIEEIQPYGPNGRFFRVYLTLKGTLAGLGNTIALTLTDPNNQPTTISLIPTFANTTGQTTSLVSPGEKYYPLESTTTKWTVNGNTAKSSQPKIYLMYNVVTPNRFMILSSGQDTLQSTNIFPIYGNPTNTTFLGSKTATSDQLSVKLITGNSYLQILTTNTINITAVIPPTPMLKYEQIMGYITNNTENTVIFSIHAIIGNYEPYQYIINDIFYDLTNYPYGIGSGSLNRFQLALSLLVDSKSDNPLIYQMDDSNQPPTSGFTLDPYNDITYPTFGKMEAIHLDSDSFLLRIHASDTGSGIAKIVFNDIEIYPEDLVSGNINFGVFEKVIPYSYVENTNLRLIDNAGLATINPTFIDILTLKEPPTSPIDIKYDVTKITEFYFNSTTLDVSISSQPCTLYFNISNSPTFLHPKLYLYLDVETDSSNNNNYLPPKEFKGYYNENIKKYQIDFIVPPRLFTGDVRYELEFFPYKWSCYMLRAALPTAINPILKVVSQDADIMPPLVSSISILSDSSVIEFPSGGSELEIGWKVTIEDMYNGLDYGMINVTSDIDYLPYEFKFDPVSNQTSPFLGEYFIKLKIYPNCKTQQYSLDSILLADRSGHVSLRMSGRDGIDSFLKIPDLSPYTITVTCSFQKNPVGPIITLDEFKALPESIDVGSVNRTLSFEIQVSAIWTPSRRHSPIVYLQARNRPEMLQCQSKLIDCNATSTQCRYNCSMSLPYGFSNGYGILLSLYGITDQNMNIRGFSGLDLKNSSKSYFINTTFSKNPIIENVSPIKIAGGKVTIWGNRFGVSPADLSLNTLTMDNIHLQVIHGNSALFLSVIPTDYVPPSPTPSATPTLSPPLTPPPTISPTPSPTPSPTTEPPTLPPTPLPAPKCSGNPECGGPDQGRCTEDGCKCIDPWMGKDCMSKPLIVPIGTVNDTVPVMIQSIQGSSKQSETIVTQVNIIELRELSLSGNIVEKYPLSTWSFDIISNTSEKISTIPIEDQNTNTNSKSESYIAVNIPKYDESIILDPDFSHLVDVNPAKDDPNAHCKKKGLTVAQIAGIAVGAGVAFIAVTIALIILIKKKYYISFKSNSIKLVNTRKH